jgi:electron-transferring-flavoprotein dehydrogenase
MIRQILLRKASSSKAASAASLYRGLQLEWIHTSSTITQDESTNAPAEQEPESMHYDVAIVGAGPAGLSAAIRLKQLCAEKNKDLSVCVVEKGAEVGAHILSGNVFQPTALDELLPGWKDDPSCPITACPTTKDRFYMLTKRTKLRLPTPPQMKNKGNYVISLSEMVKWLGGKAEELGVEIYPGFAGAAAIYGADGSVRGIRTNDVGIAKDGHHKEGLYTPGMALTATATLLAEGCRGSLSAEIMKKYSLCEKSGADPQTYALGIKEVWEIDPEKHIPGMVWHTVGWPLPMDTYGGGWLYHMSENRVSLGLVVGLDYKNTYLSPYQEFQNFKRHPAIAKLLQGATCLQYGARSLNEGGIQAIPALSFPGGALVGDAAGFLNVAKIKGTHTAMKSGMLAAESAFKALTDVVASTSLSSSLSALSSPGVDLSSYEDAVKNSWIQTELHGVRNIRPGFTHFGGLLGGLAHAALDTYILRGNAPWTFHHRRADNEALRPAAECTKIEYPRPDGVLTFDVPTSLYRSGTNHDHNQPSHLRLRNSKVPEVLNLPVYDGPEARYCPAGVYEYVSDDAEGVQGEESENKKRKLQINAQNCLHCKACDIKDPNQNIQWTPPEGGGGPSYTLM